MQLRWKPGCRNDGVHRSNESCTDLHRICYRSSLSLRYNSVMAITRRKKEVLDFLTNFTQTNGYSPSYEEIASGLGLNSLATVHKHVTNLQSKGMLQRAHNRSRSIDVLPAKSVAKRSPDRMPLLGRIAAGRRRASLWKTSSATAKCLLSR